MATDLTINAHITFRKRQEQNREEKANGCNIIYQHMKFNSKTNTKLISKRKDEQ